MYAILSHGGRQYRVSAGDRLLVDRLDAAVGSVLALEPVLLTGGDGVTRLGAELDGLRVAVTVVAHRRGEKLRIFKYKPKKRSRKVAGYRSDLTELRVDSFLSKGDALPRTGEAAGDAPAGRPAAPRARRATRATPSATPTVAVEDAQPAAESKSQAASTTKPGAAEPKAAAPRAPRASGGTKTRAGAKPATEAASDKTAPAGATAPKARKAASPKSRTKETGDGA